MIKYWPKLLSVRPCGYYRIWLSYSDGACGEVDLSDIVGKGVFLPLKEKSFFDKVYKDEETGAIAWNGELDICADAYYMKLTGKNILDIGNYKSCLQ